MTCINKYAGLISLELQMIRRLQPASGRLFEPGCLRVILKEALLLNSKARAPGNLITKIEFQGQHTVKTDPSRTFLWKDLAPKVLHVWNEEFQYQIFDMSFIESTIKFTVYGEFDQGTQVEVGSETFYFPLLYYNGHGLKDHFYIYKEGIAVGKVLIQSIFEPYEVENQHILMASDKNHLYSHQKLEAQDSLLMDGDD